MDALKQKINQSERSSWEKRRHNKKKKDKKFNLKENHTKKWALNNRNPSWYKPSAERKTPSQLPPSDLEKDSLRLMVLLLILSTLNSFKLRSTSPFFFLVLKDSPILTLESELEVLVLLLRSMPSDKHSLRESLLIIKST